MNAKDYNGFTPGDEDSRDSRELVARVSRVLVAGLEHATMQAHAALDRIAALTGEVTR